MRAGQDDGPVSANDMTLNDAGLCGEARGRSRQEDRENGCGEGRSPYGRHLTPIIARTD
jgi:hypothetical protein